MHEHADGPNDDPSEDATEPADERDDRAHLRDPGAEYPSRISAETGPSSMDAEQAGFADPEIPDPADAHPNDSSAGAGPG